MLLRRDGYWTATSVKVELSKAEKRKIGRATSPRWEIDVVAYKGATNEILAIECKSFLDSVGVKFRNGRFDPEKTYKLFCSDILRKTVLGRLRRQLVEEGACAQKPRVQLCMAVGKIARSSDRAGLEAHFQLHGWQLFDERWIREKLRETSNTSFENDVAHVVAKLLVRGSNEHREGPFTGL